MPIISVIGDGQLARMMQTEAIELGLSLRVLAGAPDSSAAQVCADVQLGDYTNLEDLQTAAAGCSAFTFDHEHVPNAHLETLIEQGVNVQPVPSALVHAQDKLVMRTKLESLGAPVPAFQAISCVADAQAFWDRTGGQVCLKTCRGGYDGHGVWFPSSLEEFQELVTTLVAKGAELLAEEKVNLVRELSAMVARTPSGEVKAWPVVESVQTDGICTEAIAPAPGLSAQLSQQAQELAITIATKLGVTGVLAVELFQVDNQGQPAIVVNELAMRPHNTGHWTQDGSTTSQFEQHLRAVMDWPLGDTTPTAPVTVMVNTLGAPSEPSMDMTKRMQEVFKRYPQAKIHLYGKDHRPGRKLGHINMCGEDVETTVAAAKDAAHFLVHGTWQ